MSSIDWKKESSGGDRTIYPTGTYKVMITGWQDCESKKGTPQIRWFADVVEPDQYKGKTIVDHTALSSSALWRIANMVQACGVDLSNAPTTELLSDAFKRILDLCVNRTTYWRLKLDEEYNNNKIEEYILDDKQDTIEPTEEETDPECPFPPTPE